jgi:hypothetical protein
VLAGCFLSRDGKTLAKMYFAVKLLSFKFRADVTTYYFGILRRKLWKHGLTTAS